MRQAFSRRPSPALVISLIALFVALGGTAVAAKVLIRSSAQIRPGVISGSDLKAETIRSDKIKNGTVALDDLQAGARAAIQNAGTQALEAFRPAGPTGAAKGSSQKVVTLANIPAGTYAIFAKTILAAKNPLTGFFGQGTTVSGHCTLDASGDTDQGRALLGTPGANSPAAVHMQITRGFAETGTATLTCDVEVAEWSAANSSIIAIRVGSSPRTSVQG